MTRRDPTTSAGCVLWPVDDPAWKDSGEGGMWAALVVPALEDEPLNVCASPTGTIALPLPDVTVHDPGHIYTDGQRGWSALLNQPKSADRDREIDAAAMNAGRPVLACIVLGASGGSWWNDTVGEYFEVTAQHLNAEGARLVEAVEALFARPAHIVTYLDT
jgi:hypothetical protein